MTAQLPNGPSITSDREHVIYVDGQHQLVLQAEWSFLPKTPDHPIDLEIVVGDMEHVWTEPAGEPIPAARWERILDEIAAHFSTGHVADVIGPGGALLRGASKFRFYLDLPPDPSRYFEIGHYLAIPMMPDETNLALDATGIVAWTSPQGERLPPGKLDEILARAVKEKAPLGVVR